MILNFILGFDGCNDPLVEVLPVFLLGAIKRLPHLISSWESFKKESLDLAELNGIYFVKHFKSLVGKHFKKAIQMIHFVYYQFMDAAQRELWSSLCHLAPYVYQTSIPNLEEYLKELSQKLDIFLHHVIKMSAKWVNKPKFHISFNCLILLEDLVHPIFATEKFESYNSVWQKASVLSNSHRAGRDLAITFAKYECMQAVLSGATLYNNDTKSYFQPSSNITVNMFQAPIIQQSMGYNKYIDTLKIYPQQTHKKLDSASKLPNPQNLQDIYPTKIILQIHSLIIEPKNTTRTTQ
ncbi:hypothetical protein VP01_3458g3 [Puccinia sorghi]|uniref:Uncharacterized protein n=1 Tax=Puccinia sorghi TaxID=27349 RepID=A0A0L6UY06_9BASI|nr:hypothetical protein VP01_3458g3 [Puccinia sorghi]